MKVEKTGLAKQIKREEPKVLLSHGFTHLLNLADCDAIKASKVIKNSLNNVRDDEGYTEVAETRWQIERYQNRH